MRPRINRPFHAVRHNRRYSFSFHPNQTNTLITHLHPTQTDKRQRFPQTNHPKHPIRFTPFATSTKKERSLSVTSLLLWEHRDSNPGPSACKAESAYFSLFFSIFIYSYKHLFISHKYTIFIQFYFYRFHIIFYICVEVVLKLCIQTSNRRKNAVLKRRYYDSGNIG